MCRSNPSKEEAAKIRDVLAKLTPPDAIAEVIAFLVSDEARYITGANVDIHGGELIIA